MSLFRPLLLLCLANCFLNAVSEDIVAKGSESGNRDDDRSYATCPEGYVVSDCKTVKGLVHTQSDGVYVEADKPGVCTAVNGYWGSGVIAEAKCAKNQLFENVCGVSKLPEFINFFEKGEAPKVTCPKGYKQTVCMGWSPWKGMLKGVNSDGRIPNDQDCAVSGCERGNWCAVSSVCRIIDIEQYKMEVCPGPVTGRESGNHDDDRSYAKCPEGYVVSDCKTVKGLVHTQSDGVYVAADEPGVCTAVNGAWGSGVIAEATCAKNELHPNPCGGDVLPEFINFFEKGKAAKVTCPKGYKQTVCMGWSPWRGMLKGVNSDGRIPNDQDCAVSGCERGNWCAVSSVCRITDMEQYKKEVCPDLE